MNFINQKLLIAPLVGLSAVLVPVAGNAQMFSHSCHSTPEIDRTSDMAVSTPDSAMPCISETVETIYNPNPTIQLSL